MTEACCLRESQPVPEDWRAAQGQDPPVVIPEWSSADLVFVTDLQGRFTFVNRSWQQHLGQSLLKSDLLPRKQLPRAAGYFAQNAMGHAVGPVELRLIEGILRYAEIGHGALPLEPVDANAVVAEVLEQIAPPPRVTVRMDSPLPVVFCARIRLAQVFQNLLSNAVKYLDKPDGRIRVGCVEEGEFWKFHVTDNGPGIETQHCERIFRIFQTLTPKDDGESTGIGLTLVKKIVERCGGKVWVESEVGKGSTFCFTWPKTKEEEPVWENR